MGHWGGKWKKESNRISVYISGQRSFNSRPASTYSKAALKETKGLLIDRTRGHLTPSLLSQLQGENRDKINKGILERSVGRARILVDRANTHPQCSQTFQLKTPQEHLGTTSTNSYISQQAITSTALVKSTENHSQIAHEAENIKVGRAGNIWHLTRVNPMLYFCCWPEEHETIWKCK